ncbi:UDP-N-acetyl glucosamine 2-epimerase [Planctomycetales bacterium 10988]|nr:UDP-N-acetyl glucosamine 2-epimerase [Planctomycetales bacterium 10988]
MGTRALINCLIGTRPEAIKMAPLVLALRKLDRFDVQVVLTNQHPDIESNILSTFNLSADHQLQSFFPHLSLSEFLGKTLISFDQLLKFQPPQCVLAQGDTTTALAAAMGSRYQKVLFGHLEAGLRTENRLLPFPEELNRRMIGQLADYHFTPSSIARKNLIREGIPSENIFVTGNTINDAVAQVISRPEILPWPAEAGQKRVLCTIHRRENFGKPLLQICQGIKELALADKINFYCLMHPNPQVKQIMKRELLGYRNIHLLEPVAYPIFLKLLQQADLIVSDSGGIQEEAPCLGRPLLILRESTERPEVLACGSAKLIGSSTESFIENIEEVFSNQTLYKIMTTPSLPYGGPGAALKICNILSMLLHADQENCFTVDRQSLPSVA